MHLLQALVAIGSFFPQRTAAIPINRKVVENNVVVSRSHGPAGNGEYVETHLGQWASDTKLCGESPGQHAGYINVNDLNENNTLNMAFWFFEAFEDNEETPLYIIIGGEVGVPVSKSVFGPNGPCVVTGDINTMPEEGQHSHRDWTNTLYIESPIGLGFSYAEGAAVADRTEEEYLYTFIQRFYESFPQYVKRRVLIEAFDLGAKAATKLTKSIITQNDVIAKGEQEGFDVKLDSLILISPYIDPAVQVSYTPKVYWSNALGEPFLSQTKAGDFTGRFDLWRDQHFGDEVKGSPERNAKRRMQRFMELWHGVTEGYDAHKHRYPDIDPFNIREVRQDRVSEFLYHSPENDAVQKWLRDGDNQRKIGFVPFADAGKDHATFSRQHVDDMLNNTFFDSTQDEFAHIVASKVQVVLVGGDMDAVTSWMSLFNVAFRTPGVKAFLEAAYQPFQEGLTEGEKSSEDPHRLGDANSQNRAWIKNGGNLQYILIKGAGHDISRQEPDLFHDLVKHIAFPQSLEPQAIDDLPVPADNSTLEIPSEESNENQLHKRQDPESSKRPEELQLGPLYNEAFPFASPEELQNTPLTVEGLGSEPFTLPVETQNLPLSKFDGTAEQAVSEAQPETDGSHAELSSSLRRRGPPTPDPSLPGAVDPVPKGLESVPKLANAVTIPEGAKVFDPTKELGELSRLYHNPVDGHQPGVEEIIESIKSHSGSTTIKGKRPDPLRGLDLPPGTGAESPMMVYNLRPLPISQWQELRLAAHKALAETGYQHVGGSLKEDYLDWLMNTDLPLSRSVSWDLERAQGVEKWIMDPVEAVDPLQLPVDMPKPGGMSGKTAAKVAGGTAAVGGIAGGIAGGVSGGGGQAAAGIASAARGVVDGAGTAAGGVAEGVGTAAGVAEGVGTAAGGVANGVGTAAGVAEGVGSAAGGVVDGVGSTAGGVMEGVGGALNGLIPGGDDDDDEVGGNGAGGGGKKHHHHDQGKHDEKKVDGKSNKAAGDKDAGDKKAEKAEKAEAQRVVEGEEDDDGDYDKQDRKIRQQQEKETKQEKKEFNRKAKEIKKTAQRESKEAKQALKDAKLEHKDAKKEFKINKKEGKKALKPVKPAEKKAKQAYKKASNKAKGAKKPAKKVLKKIKQAAEAEQRAQEAIEMAMDGSVGQAVTASHDYEVAHELEKQLKQAAGKADARTFEAENRFKEAKEDMEKLSEDAEEKSGYAKAITKGTIPMEDAVAAQLEKEAGNPGVSEREGVEQA